MKSRVVRDTIKKVDLILKELCINNKINNTVALIKYTSDLINELNKSINELEATVKQIEDRRDLNDENL